MFLDPVGLDLTAVNLNELELVGSVVYDHQDFRQAVEWIDANRFEFQKMVTHILPLDMAQDALALLSDRNEDAVKVLLEIAR
jgi:threonine dehydrogenase-like Zn-dependent dehydrogenase